MLLEVMRLDFAVQDSALFLDLRPQDECALQYFREHLELLLAAKDELFAANQAIETQETCKQHLNTAKDRFQQAQSILEAQFSSEENQTGAELVQLTSQALQDTEQAIEAQGGDLNTKAQLALCRFLGAYAIAMNQ